LQYALASAALETKKELSIYKPLLCRLTKPDGSHRVVLRHSLALLIHEGYVVLTSRVALVRSLAVPAESFGVVLRHTLAVKIHIAETILTTGVALVGGFTAPAESLAVILRYPLAVGIHVCKLGLSLCVTLVGADPACSGALGESLLCDFGIMRLPDEYCRADRGKTRSNRCALPHWGFRPLGHCNAKFCLKIKEGNSMRFHS